MAETTVLTRAAMMDPEKDAAWASWRAEPKAEQMAALTAAKMVE
jgi:predicted NAD/FAD-binding protein